jgi:hypothetical protein
MDAFDMLMDDDEDDDDALLCILIRDDPFFSVGKDPTMESLGLDSI